MLVSPVRAKAVKGPQQWKWSSYRATAGVVEPHRCLRVEDILGRLGRRKTQAQERYREFVRAGVEGASIWEELKGQSLLGDKGFVERLIGYVRGKQEIKNIPKGQRYLRRPSL